MGMAASQARLLSLQARQSNLEYQGQQINQERTILSQQCTALYNSLLAMTVPTPPSTNDFTTVKYEGVSGATRYEFDASSVKPGKDGLYTLTLGTIEYGASLVKNNGYVSTSKGTETMSGTYVSTTDTKDVPTGNYEPIDNANPETFLVKLPEKPTQPTGAYVLDGTAYRPATQDDIDDLNVTNFYRLNNENEEFAEGNIAVKAETKSEPIVHSYKEAELANLYVVVPGSNEVIKVPTTNNQYVTYDPESKKYTLNEGYRFFYSGAGSDTASKQASGAAGDGKNITIAGHEAMTLENAKAGNYITQEQYDGYVNAINNAQISLADNTVCGPDQFYIYFDNDYTPHFALRSDVETDNSAVTYNFIANGEYTKNTPYENCNLTFDPATGRITAMDIPATKDAEGNPLTYTTIAVSATTVTDENAYQDAYAQYEYEQYQYDKKQQEINAKTEIIQQEDRNLELKLQRLDNERQQIKTEIDAVDKVIDENIEKSYKTFSG